MASGVYQRTEANLAGVRAAAARRRGRPSGRLGVKMSAEFRAKVSTGRKRHGMTNTPTWRSWRGMFIRCETPSSTQYPSYGARGITVCERWRTFENFLADMGLRPAETTLDRIDNDGNYEPGNCRWATRSVQRRNQRPFTAERRARLSAAGREAWRDPEKRNRIVMAQRSAGEA